MKYDAFIFDIDGVLIDTSQSFSKAVLKAVSIATGSPDFTLNELSILREIGGFNNDWNTAIAGAAWIQFCSDIPFRNFIKFCRQSKYGIQGVQHYVKNLNRSFEKKITRLVQEAYGGTTKCKLLYGFHPQTIFIDGYWLTEEPLVDAPFIDSLPQQVAVVTGRNKAEAQLAFDILGWSVDCQSIAVSDDPELDKPNPEKLIQLVNFLGCKSPLFFGDTRDDMDLIHNYFHESGQSMDFCLVGNNLKLPNYGLRTDSVKNFINNMRYPND